MAAETGLEQHGIEAEPLFKNAEAIRTADIDALSWDRLSRMDYRDVLKQGYDNLFQKHFQALYDFFAPDNASPAIDRGSPLPDTWPDTVQIRDGKPDIGAVEY